MNELKYDHLMVDIETLGTDSRSVITQISAVQFNLETGDILKTFDQHVDIKDCMHQGLEVNADTLMWWMTQDKAALRKFTSAKRKPLKESLVKFTQFIADTGITYLWGNSARFDLGLLSDAYKVVDEPLPWKFWNELDVRTLVFMEPTIKDNLAFKGIQHNAIDDCKHQIEYCSKTYNVLKSSNG